MSQLRPIKRKLNQEELRAVFNRDHWYFLHENDACHEVINYFDGSFTKLDRQEAVAIFSELEPAFVNYRTAEQNAVGHTDVSTVEDFIFQVGVMFRTLEQAFSGFSAGRFADLKKSFIEREPPKVRTRVVNPFDLLPFAFKELGSHSSSAPPSKKSRSAPAAPVDSDDNAPAANFFYAIGPWSWPSSQYSRQSPCPTLNYRTQNAEVVIDTTAPSPPSPKKTGKARQPIPPHGSPAPNSKTRYKSDEDSIQVVSKPADRHPVESPGEFNPSAVETANLRYKGRGSKVHGGLPSAPPIAPTVVPKHLVVSAVLPAEDARSLVPCYDCLSRGRICMFAGINKRCYNCVRNGQACTNGAQSFPAMVALDRLEPVLATTSRRFNTHLKNLARASHLVQVHQEFAEKVLSPAHFKQRFQDTIRDLFKQFEITFEDAREHYLLTHPVREILENDDGEAMHILPVDSALTAPLERSAPPVLPDAIRASYSRHLCHEARWTAQDFTPLESAPIVPSMKVGPPINARGDETPRPSVSSLGSSSKPNPFSRPPRDLQAINRELSAPPSIATLHNEAPPSPEAEPVDDDMGGGAGVGLSGVEEAPLGATARLFLRDMSLL
ncbi:hypothetical protein DFH07DRAFT_783022 [Mycena maculata]|uniref:Uncharacterized protein n=1 Tax=Mycena maculata TaxID=230809 RepID=A0AAD7HQX3_9AGAR|nr:hypothetical protein DFH07DRAFT_783022 [Mycena maculata]